MRAPEIRFGTDGWRAVIADEFTFANVRICAGAVAIHLQRSGIVEPAVLVGYDTRFGSRSFALKAAQGLVDFGVTSVTVADRPVPTPALSLGVVQGGYDIGIMITASHNPAEWNGVKVKSAEGGSASPEEVAQIESCLDEARLHNNSVTATGYQTESADLMSPYEDTISRLVDIDAIRGAGLSVAVDSMHGTGAGVVGRVLEGVTTSVTELRAESNPGFPGMKQPEPIGENLTQLSNLVASSDSDVGIATDGDADRLGIIDESGVYVTTLEVFSMLFHHLKLRRNAPGGVASTVTMSSMVDVLARHHGTDSVRTPVGFKFVGPAMLENSCALGGEESGGYAFAGHIPERDGPLSALMFLESMALTGKQPTQLLAEIHEITGPRTFRRIDCEFPPSDRNRIANLIDQDIAPSTFVDGAESVDKTDGLRVEFQDAAWGVARMSGTEPLVRLYAEAPTTEQRESILQSMARYLAIRTG